MTHSPQSLDLPKPELEVLLFERPEDWTAWLEEHHSTRSGVWLRLAKKLSPLSSISYAQALDEALCYGWIDGQKKTYDGDSWIQKFTPRSKKSLWSKVNREKVAALIQSGKMQPAGQKEIDRARSDGRWNAAYDPASRAEVPNDLSYELSRSPAAQQFFATLNSQNRYAILFRIQTAKKPETRARRIQQFIAMLEKQEKIYP